VLRWDSLRCDQQGVHAPDHLELGANSHRWLIARMGGAGPELAERFLGRWRRSFGEGQDRCGPQLAGNRAHRLADALDVLARWLSTGRLDSHARSGRRFRAIVGHRLPPGSRATAVSFESITSVSASRMALATSTHLGAVGGGSWPCCSRSGCLMIGDAERVGLADQFLLQQRHFLRWHPTPRSPRATMTRSQQGARSDRSEIDRLELLDLAITECVAGC